MKPVQLTEPIRAAIVQAVSQGVPLNTAVRATGLSIESVYKLLERSHTGEGISAELQATGQQFAIDLDKARAVWEASRVAAIQAIAANPDHRDTLRANEWFLNNHPTTRQTYRPERHSTVEHQVKDPAVAQVHQTVHALADDELLALGDGS